MRYLLIMALAIAPFANARLWADSGPAAPALKANMDAVGTGATLGVAASPAGKDTSASNPWWPWIVAAVVVVVVAVLIASNTRTSANSSGGSSGGGGGGYGY